MDTPPKGHFLKLVAHSALDQFVAGNNPGDLQQVGHISGYIKFAVDQSESRDRQLLAVHYPRPERNYKPDAAHLRSRKQFLVNAIDHGGIQTPRPIPSPEGKLVLSIEIESPYWDGPCYSSLTEWESGDPLNQDDSDHVEIVAKEMASLHNFADGWVSKDDHFSLPSFDQNTWKASLGKLNSAVEAGRILPEHYNTLCESTQLAIHEVETAHGPENGIGIIHGDMMPGNLLQSGPNIWIIDFDNSGIGYFAQDIAWVLTQLTPDNRHVFVNTYGSVRRKGSPTQRELEIHFIQSQIYHSSWWVNDPGHGFSNIPNLCGLCLKLNHGKAFLYA